MSRMHNAQRVDLEEYTRDWKNDKKDVFYFKDSFGKIVYTIKDCKKKGISGFDGFVYHNIAYFFDKIHLYGYINVSTGEIIVMFKKQEQRCMVL